VSAQHAAPDHATGTVPTVPPTTIQTTVQLCQSKILVPFAENGYYSPKFSAE